jgi:hypothetical protein
MEQRHSATGSNGLRTNDMTTKNLTRRLERLEAELEPDDSQVLRLTVTRIGEPVKIVEFRIPKPEGRRRSWRSERKRHR